MNLRVIRLGYFNIASLKLPGFSYNALLYEVCFFLTVYVSGHCKKTGTLDAFYWLYFESLFSTWIIQQQLSVFFKFTGHIVIATDLHSEISRVMLKDSMWMVSCEVNSKGLIRPLYISIKVRSQSLKIKNKPSNTDKLEMHELFLLTFCRKKIDKNQEPEEEPERYRRDLLCTVGGDG